MSEFVENIFNLFLVYKFAFAFNGEIYYVVIFSQIYDNVCIFKAVVYCIGKEINYYTFDL